MSYTPFPQNNYGFRYNKSSWADISDFTNNGATVSAIGNQLSFSGGASDFSQWINIPDGTCLERWSLSTRLVITTTGSGLAIGSRSYYLTGTPRWLIAILNTGTGALSIGVGGNPGPQVMVTASSTLSFSATDEIELRIEQDGYNAKAKVRNLTTNAAAISCQYTYTTDPNTVTRTMPNTSYMGVWNLGGSFAVSFLQWNVLLPRNPKLMVVGDSLSKGYYCTGFGRRFGDLLNSYFTPTLIAAGGGDTTASILARLNEIITIRPSAVLLLIGVNDVIKSISSSVYIPNYDSIVSQLSAAGIAVYHLVALYTPSVDQSPLTTHILGTYADSKIINCFTPSQQDGIRIFDNLHLNDSGELVVFDTIIGSNKLPGGNYTEQNTIRNQSLYTQSGTFAIDGNGTVGNLKVTNNIIGPAIPDYATTAAAIGDSNLMTGSFYTVTTTGVKQLYIK